MRRIATISQLRRGGYGKTSNFSYAYGGADFVHHQFCLWWGGTDPNHFILALGAWQPMLFVFAFIFGIVAVLVGIGGGVLFVPIVGAFFFLILTL